MVIMGLLFGVIFFDLDYGTYMGIQNGAGLLFMTTIFSGAMAFGNSITFACQERAIYYKERGSNTYSPLLFFASSALVEIPYTILQTMLFSAIFFPMVGFSGVKLFFWYYFILSLFHLNMTYLGQVLAWALPALNVAFVVQQLMITIFALYAGFNPPKANIPQGLIFLYYLAFPRYALDMIGGAIFGDCPTPGGDELGCKVLSGVPPTVSTEPLTVAQLVTASFNFNHDELWANFGAHLGFMALFLLLGAMSIKYVNWQRR
jgi:ABC-type multidrug transport system permease subunit